MERKITANEQKEAAAMLLKSPNKLSCLKLTRAFEGKASENK